MTEKDHVARIRLPRKLWERYGELVGDGSRRKDGRSPRIVELIEADCERLERERLAAVVVGRSWHEDMGEKVE